MLLLIYTVLQKMDLNKDGVISLEEFIETCRRVRRECCHLISFDDVYLKYVPSGWLY